MVPNAFGDPLYGKKIISSTCSGFDSAVVAGVFYASIWIHVIFGKVMNHDVDARNP